MAHVYLISLFCVGVFVLHALKQIWLSRRLPPGPRGLPILGNFSHRPPPGCKEWEHWLRFKDLYGPISSITTMGQTIVLLNDSHVTEEMLERRSGSSASRPPSVVTHDLVGWNRMVTMQGDYTMVRSHRKYITHLLGSSKAISRFSDKLSFEVRRLLLRLLVEPSELEEHIRRQAGTTILKLVYGYNVEPSGEDALVHMAELSTTHFSVAARPGAWLIDIIPILKYLPAWCPGTAVKDKAREWKRVLDTLSEKPYKFVLRQREKGVHEESYVSRHLDDLGDEPSPTEEFTIKWTSPTMYAAGADTTVSAIRTFFLAMALHPTIQRKAQEEIEEAVGMNTLPQAEDQEHLPYTSALLKEVLRWHPVAPLGVAHATTEDQQYENYLIPKGAIIVPNIWAITHDPGLYSDPMSFDPSRFIETKDNTPEPDPQKFVFGFGRRICPGRFLAEATLFLTIAQTLSVFKIAKPVRNGREVEVLADFEPGIISHPASYEVSILPRSTDAEQLIRAVESEDPWAPGDSAELEKFSMSIPNAVESAA